MTETTDYRNISTQDLAVLGMHNLAYLKPVLHQGEPAFAIHAADGTLVAMTATRIAAELLVRNNELEPVSVH
ncbi:MAG TPA: DUF1150 family protein [Alphaproteobacteria bacterium]|nr:DUF1150 family protein [Alphaproteobacteria bacterium]